MHLTGKWEIPGGHRRRNGTFKMTETTRYIKICKASLGATSTTRRRGLLRPGSVIALKGGKNRNTKYCADETNRIKCNRNRLLQWEKFRVVNAGGGLIALRGGKDDKYCADEGNTIKCNRNAIGQWEKFRAVDAGGGKIALKGGRNHHRHYCADEGNQIKCNRNALHQWEKFQAVNARI